MYNQPNPCTYAMLITAIHCTSPKETNTQTHTNNNSYTVFSLHFPAEHRLNPFNVTAAPQQDTQLIMKTTQVANYALRLNYGQV